MHAGFYFNTFSVGKALYLLDFYKKWLHFILQRKNELPNS